MSVRYSVRVTLLVTKGSVDFYDADNLVMMLSEYNGQLIRANGRSFPNNYYNIRGWIYNEVTLNNTYASNLVGASGDEIVLEYAGFDTYGLATSVANRFGTLVPTQAALDKYNPRIRRVDVVTVNIERESTLQSRRTTPNPSLPTTIVQSDSKNSWVFWLLISLVVLLIFVIIIFVAVFLFRTRTIQAPTAYMPQQPAPVMYAAPPRQMFGGTK